MRPLRQIILSCRFLCQSKCLARAPHTVHKLFCFPDEHYLEWSWYAKKAVADLDFLTCHCYKVFSQAKILKSKKLIWRKGVCNLYNAEIGSSGSAGHKERSKMKHVIMLLYYSELSPSTYWFNCDLHRGYEQCGLSSWRNLSLLLVQKNQGYSLVKFRGSTRSLVAGE